MSYWIGEFEGHRKTLIWKKKEFEQLRDSEPEVIFRAMEKTFPGIPAQALVTGEVENFPAEGDETVITLPSLDILGAMFGWAEC